MTQWPCAITPSYPSAGGIVTTLVARRVALATALAFVLATGGLSAHQAPSQRLDQEYAKRIKDNTPDARILTDLIDHMPISDTVASPLKFLGYIPGENNRLFLVFNAMLNWE